MSKEIILILDNEFHTQWALKTLLESEGYAVVTVDSIDEAAKKFTEYQVSGIITEYWIENSCTLETIRKLKTVSPEVYVMMLTNGEIKENEYEKIIEAGVEDYFLKPLPINKILLHLRKGLKQRNLFVEKKRLEEELTRIQNEKVKINSIQPHNRLASPK